MTDQSRPVPSPVAVASAVSPAKMATPKITAPVVNSADQIALEQARTFGRVDAEGRVWVRESAGERQVGAYPAEVPDNPLDLYVRRFLDLQAQVDLAQARIPTLNSNDIDTTLKALRESLTEPHAVGDLDTLRARVEKLTELGEERKVEVAKEKEAAKEKALAERTKIVATAEKIAAQEPERTQWKQSGQRLRDLLEEWKNLQRRGPRIDRATEDALWKRFSSARTAFDRHRKQFFSQLDAAQEETRRLKEEIIRRAEALSKSTEWGNTARAYRDLMNEWKQAGRASRKDDDALWARFRAAQQVFFEAREKALEASDAEQAENLKVKEALAAKAEALLPITDLATAKAALRPILDEWDAAGKVPRSEMARMEKRIHSVEQAISEAENEQWNRSNPETKARAEGLMGQLEGLIEQLQAKLDKARAKADEKAIKKLEEELAARQSWLDQAKRAAGES